MTRARADAQSQQLRGSGPWRLSTKPPDWIVRCRPKLRCQCHIRPAPCQGMRKQRLAIKPELIGLFHFQRENSCTRFNEFDARILHYIAHIRKYGEICCFTTTVLRTLSERFSPFFMDGYSLYEVTLLKATPSSSGWRVRGHRHQSQRSTPLVSRNITSSRSRAPTRSPDACRTGYRLL